MEQQRFAAGAEVPPGIYRCNACAKQIDQQEEQGKLPQCSACGGFSWRTSRFYRKSGSTERKR